MGGISPIGSSAYPYQPPEDLQALKSHIEQSAEKLAHVLKEMEENPSLADDPHHLQSVANAVLKIAPFVDQAMRL
jgi:hypothetical protein